MTDPAVTPRFPAVILSGGKSSRMGEPKALLPFGPARLIDHVAARIRPQAGPIALNTNDPAITLPGSPGFPDRFTGFHGPLAGIHAALAHVVETHPDATHALVVPTDSPFFPKDLVAVLAAQAWPVLANLGEYQLLTSTHWVPKPPGGGTPTYGALAFVWGTVATSVIAMLLAVPLGVATAAFLSEIAPPCDPPMPP